MGQPHLTEQASESSHQVFIGHFNNMLDTTKEMDSLFQNSVLFLYGNVFRDISHSSVEKT
jgi:hypothetical protein